MRICCDIDGVLADVREYVAMYLPHDWKTYFTYTSTFPHIWQLHFIISALLDNYQNVEVVFITGRPENNRQLTRTWLEDILGLIGILLMRQDTNHRPTYEIKREWFRKLKPDLIIDDDPEVVRVAKEEGFLVLQVHGFRATDNDMVPSNF